MSCDNVAVVRRLFEATARDDRATVFALYDPEIEWDTSRAALGLLIEGDIFHGHDGVRRFHRKYNEAWEQMDYEIDELVDAGDQVVSVVNNRRRGRMSGVEVALQMPGVWTVRDGKIVRAAFFTTGEEALVAAGVQD